MYMKKTDMLYRSRTCAKCGANVNPPNDGSNPNPSSCTRVPIRHESVVEQIVQQHQAQQTPNLSYPPKKELESIIIYRTPAANAKFQYSTDLQPGEAITAAQLQLKPAGFLDSAFKDDDDDDNDATPYATFNLPGFESDSKISDTYETFAAKFTEPPYMLLKKGLDCPPLYADSVDYKMARLGELIKPADESTIYQSTGLSQCQSIASCSSNHEELIRAYEFGKQQKQKLFKLQNEFIECLNENDDGDDTFYRSLPSDRESPTDPGL